MRLTARRWLALLIILGVLIAGIKACATLTHRTNPVDQALTRSTTPGAFSLKRIGEGLLSFGQIFHIPSLLRENNRLTQENAYLQRELDQTKALKQENAELRGIMSLTAPAFIAKPATIIARPYDLWLESVIVNVGRNDGVRIGNLVVNGLGVVGKISEAENDRSRVQLITSPRFRLGAVSSVNHDEGVIRGIDWRTLAMDYIHAGSKISLGEKINSLGEETFAGGNNNRPKGQFIGTVVSRKVDNNGFLEIIVQPAISPCQLGTLVVMTR
jgi:rod shape-determining protein MreC